MIRRAVEWPKIEGFEAIPYAVVEAEKRRFALKCLEDSIWKQMADERASLRLRVQE